MSVSLCLCKRSGLLRDGAPEIIIIIIGSKTCQILYCNKKTCAVILQTFLASAESTQCILFGGSFQVNMMLLSAVVTVKCKC